MRAGRVLRGLLVIGSLLSMTLPVWSEAGGLAATGRTLVVPVGWRDAQGRDDSALVFVDLGARKVVSVVTCSSVPGLRYVGDLKVVEAVSSTRLLLGFWRCYGPGTSLVEFDIPSREVVRGFGPWEDDRGKLVAPGEIYEVKFFPEHRLMFVGCAGGVERGEVRDLVIDYKTGEFMSRTRCLVGAQAAWLSEDASKVAFFGQKRAPGGDSWQPELTVCDISTGAELKAFDARSLREWFGEDLHTKLAGGRLPFVVGDSEKRRLTWSFQGKKVFAPDPVEIGGEEYWINPTGCGVLVDREDEILIVPSGTRDSLAAVLLSATTGRPEAAIKLGVCERAADRDWCFWGEQAALLP